MLNKSSTEKLVGVHPALVELVHKVSCSIPFIITQGLRTVAEQAQHVANGKSRTMRSRHITGHAIDFVPWTDTNNDGVVNRHEISWVFADFIPVADIFKEEARKLKIPIIWGGDWLRFRDGPHIELDRRTYP